MKKINLLNINPKTVWTLGIDPEATGQQLRSKRLAAQLTQEDLSELFEQAGDSASKNAISSWETGKKTPSLQHVVLLAGLYGCTQDELVVSFAHSMGVQWEDDQPVPQNRNHRDEDEQCDALLHPFFMLKMKGMLKKCCGIIR